MVRTKGVLYVEEPYSGTGKLSLYDGTPLEYEDEEPVLWEYNFMGGTSYLMALYARDIYEDGDMGWFYVGSMYLRVNTKGIFTYDSLEERVVYINRIYITYGSFALVEGFRSGLQRVLTNILPETRLKRLLGKTLKIAIPISPKEDPTVVFGPLYVRIAVDRHEPKISDLPEVLESRKCMESIVEHYKEQMIEDVEDSIESTDLP